MPKVKTKTEPFKLLGNAIAPGKSSRLSIEIAKLYTNTSIQIPVIVGHGKKKGPVLLLLAGVHGDEINGVETIRRVIKNGWHRPEKGTVICIPVFNIFGFLNLSREFPDGRDLNRMFPGTKNGSLASQFAYVFMHEIAPLVDIVLDFHTGGAQRSNYPQARCDFNNEAAKELCAVFSAPFTVHSPLLSKSIRSELTKIGKKYLIYEGGKSHNIDEFVVQNALDGIQRVMYYMGIKKIDKKPPESNNQIIKTSKWIRASRSGMLNLTVSNGQSVVKGEPLATLSDPYGKSERMVRAPFSGVIINVNEKPLVNKGDALFNMGKIEKVT